MIIDNTVKLTRSAALLCGAKTYARFQRYELATVGVDNLGYSSQEKDLVDQEVHYDRGRSIPHRCLKREVREVID